MSALSFCTSGCEPPRYKRYFIQAEYFCVLLSAGRPLIAYLRRAPVGCLMVLRCRWSSISWALWLRIFFDRYLRPVFSSTTGMVSPPDGMVTFRRRFAVPSVPRSTIDATLAPIRRPRTRQRRLCDSGCGSPGYGPMSELFLSGWQDGVVGHGSWKRALLSGTPCQRYTGGRLTRHCQNCRCLNSSAISTDHRRARPPAGRDGATPRA